MNRHIILTLGRSGSNALCDLLNQHPSVLNAGEVLGAWTLPRRLHRLSPVRLTDEAYLDAALCSDIIPRQANRMRNLRKRARGERDACKDNARLQSWGIKDFAFHFQRLGLDAYLVERPQIKVIGLTRSSVVDRMVSVALLDASGLVAMRAGDRRAAPKLRLDPNHLVARLDRVAVENAALDRMLSALPRDRVIRVTYEDLFADNAGCQPVIDAVFGFLGVGPCSVRMRMRKIRKTGLRDILVNFDDCLKAVDGTVYAKPFLGAA